MAVNRIFAGNEKNNLFAVVPSGTKGGDAVWVGDTPAVAITNRGDATKTVQVASLSITYPNGGVGLEDTEASLATDGTYELPVDGVVVATPPATGVVVYCKEGTGAADLTLDADDGDSPAVEYTRFGIINVPNNYNWVKDVAPVRIGA